MGGQFGNVQPLLQQLSAQQQAVSDLVASLSGGTGVAGRQRGSLPSGMGEAAVRTSSMSGMPVVHSGVEHQGSSKATWAFQGEDAAGQLLPGTWLGAERDRSVPRAFATDQVGAGGSVLG